MDVLAHRRNFPRSKSGVIGLFSPAIHKVLRLGNIFTFILILVFIFPALAICGVASNQDAVGKGKSYYFDSQYDKAIELLLPVANEAVEFLHFKKDFLYPMFSINLIAIASHYSFLEQVTNAIFSGIGKAIFYAFLSFFCCFMPPFRSS